MIGQKEPGDKEHPYRMMAFSIERGWEIPLCRSICTGRWDANESHLFLNFLEGGATTYFLPSGHPGEPPRLPAIGLTHKAELNTLPGVTTTPEFVESAESPDTYSFTRHANRRNLYRIPTP